MNKAKTTGKGFPKILNPKSETLNKFQILMYNFPNSLEFGALAFKYCLVRHASWRISASDLGFFHRR